MAAKNFTNAVKEYLVCINLFYLSLLIKIKSAPGKLQKEEIQQMCRAIDTTQSKHLQTTFSK